MASLFGCSGVCEKKSDSDAGEEEGEALAAAANDEALAFEDGEVMASLLNMHLMDL